MRIRALAEVHLASDPTSCHPNPTWVIAPGTVLTTIEAEAVDGVVLIDAVRAALLVEVAMAEVIR